MSNSKNLPGIPVSLAFDSEDDNTTLGSEVEDLLIDVDWSQKEYWLGKKYFKFTLAEQLLRNSHPDESLAELDSRLQASLRDHPFEDNLKFIQDQVSDSLLRDSSDGCEGLLTTFGSILRKGSKAEIKLLVLSLRKHRTEKASLGTTPTAFRGKDIEAAEPIFEDIAHTSDLGSYSQALKEYGEQIGVQPNFTTETKQFYPPRFEASLVFKGLNIRAEAKSKKEARQRAAKEACQNLRIRVE